VASKEQDVHKWRYCADWFPHFNDRQHRDVTRELKPAQEKLLLYILDKCKKKGYSWVSRSTMAADTNISRTSLHRHLLVLYEKRWLKKAGFQNSTLKLEPSAKAIKHFFE